jgi:hypothetical protein
MFVQGKEDNPKDRRPAEWHQKRLKDQKHEVSQAQHYTVE